MSKPVALVTGASRGIGRAIALKLAESGHTVIICSRTADPSNLDKGAYEVKNTIEAAGGSAAICRADISLPQERQNLFSFVEKEFGRLDLLVNNAGIEPVPVDVLEMQESELDRVFDTNLKGPLFISQHFAARMIEWKRSGVIENGRIVFITSVQAYIAAPSNVSYKMSKASLSMLVKCLAVRLGDDGIPVFEISPGVFPTDMCLPHKDSVEKSYFTGGKIITPRWGDVDEIGDLVAYMASGKLDYSTGSQIELAGGWGVRKF